jgi:hypothetical protein
MTLREFISVWHAQPFRAFRIRARGEIINVQYPLSVALTPQLKIAAVVDNTRVEIIGFHEIEQCDVFGLPTTIADLLDAISPDDLSRNAQLISEALSRSTTLTEEPSPAAFSTLRASLQKTRTPEGIFLVQAVLELQNGHAVLSTVGTRWNVHGIEHFENGASLYLHHLDHPMVEQRIIFWPPDRGTFESFDSAMPADALAKELHRRDVELSTKPARPLKPSASYFRKIDVEWPISDKDGWEEAFGEDTPAMDPLRFEFVSVPRIVERDRIIQNPCLTDIMKEEILFNLVDTDWDSAARQDGRNWYLSLRHLLHPEQTMTLNIDVKRRAATIDLDSKLISLTWIERHLKNFSLYESWGQMYSALRHGPVKRRRPDVRIPLSNGFLAELWAGEPQYPLPYLQPHILDPNGETLFDLRDTFWSASIRSDGVRPNITLILSSGERTGRDATNYYSLDMDLVSHQVTCSRLEGSTTIGMLQGMVRRVRGVEWMLEELPQWFAKGRSLEGP